MICRNCKFSLSGSEKYCPNCGAPLHEEEVSSDLGQVSPPKAPDIFFTPVSKEEKDEPEIFRSKQVETEENPAEAPKKAKQKSSSKAPVFLMLILITAVLVVGISVAAEKFNIAPTLMSYLNGVGKKATATDASELVYAPEESLIPSPESGTVQPDINYAPTEAYVARINVLSLRKGPSDAYGLIRSLDAGTPLQIIGGTAITDSWIYVYVPSEDCFGWLNAAFISLYTYTQTTTAAPTEEYTAAYTPAVTE